MVLVETMDPLRRDLVAEELAAFDTSLSSRIHSADLIADTIGERDAEVARIASRYEDVFKNKQDAVYFAMLPLSGADREKVLDRAREIMRIEKSEGFKFTA